MPKIVPIFCWVCFWLVSVASSNAQLQALHFEFSWISLWISSWISSIIFHQLSYLSSHFVCLPVASHFVPFRPCSALWFGGALAEPLWPGIGPAKSRRNRWSSCSDCSDCSGFEVAWSWAKNGLRRSQTKWPKVAECVAPQVATRKGLSLLSWMPVTVMQVGSSVNCPRLSRLHTLHSERHNIWHRRTNMYRLYQKCIDCMEWQRFGLQISHEILQLFAQLWNVSHEKLRGQVPGSLELARVKELSRWALKY